jgi:hypothetical protein
MDTPATFSSLIDKLGGPAVVARATKANPDAARQWKLRENIPGAYWDSLIDLAKAKRVRGVSIALLSGLARRAKEKSAA